ncbi:hypothetical protein Bca4012_052584 [Brassica carinata]
MPWNLYLDQHLFAKRLMWQRKLVLIGTFKLPTVTLEGDIFQPSDLLTGGSRKYVILSIVFCHYHVFTKMMLGCKVRH